MPGPFRNPTGIGPPTPGRWSEPGRLGCGRHRQPGRSTCRLERMEAMTACESSSPPPGARWIPSTVRMFTSTPDAVGEIGGEVPLAVGQHGGGGEVGGHVRPGIDLHLHHAVDGLHLAVELGSGHRGHTHPQHPGTGRGGIVDEGPDPLAVAGVPAGCSIGDAGVPAHQGLGIIGPDHHHHQLRVVVGQVHPELGGPVEVVGPGQAGVLPAVEGRGDHAGGARSLTRGCPRSRPIESPTTRTRSGSPPGWGAG